MNDRARLALAAVLLGGAGFALWRLLRTDAPAVNPVLSAPRSSNNAVSAIAGMMGSLFSSDSGASASQAETPAENAGTAAADVPWWQRRQQQQKAKAAQQKAPKPPKEPATDKPAPAPKPARTVKEPKPKNGKKSA